MASGLQDLIPGLREAEDRQRRENAEAFAGIEPRICGMIDVLPFTPAMFIELDGVENAFFAAKGTPITEADVAIFLWRTSPYFQRDDETLKRFFVANLAVLPYDRAVTEINEYVRRAWRGMPLWEGKASSERPLAQWPSRLVHIFASEYGWAEEYILNLPFRRLWQYANRILESGNEKYRERCAEAMKLRAEWLARVNAEEAAAKERN